VPGCGFSWDFERCHNERYCRFSCGIDQRRSGRTWFDNSFLMSTIGNDHPSSNQSDHYDVSDVFLSFDSDQSDDQAVDAPGDSSTPDPSLPATCEECGRKRTPYGQGIEAKRTAPFRQYRPSNSPMYRTLRKQFTKITKKLLRGLSDDACRGAGQHGVVPPSRNQKRQKRGLIMWMDQNSELMLNYLQTL
jgi:hypothetical protein